MVARGELSEPEWIPRVAKVVMFSILDLYSPRVMLLCSWRARYVSDAAIMSLPHFGDDRIQMLE